MSRVSPAPRSQPNGDGRGDNWDQHQAPGPGPEPLPPEHQQRQRHEDGEKDPQQYEEQAISASGCQRSHQQTRDEGGKESGHLNTNTSLNI